MPSVIQPTFLRNGGSFFGLGDFCGFCDTTRSLCDENESTIDGAKDRDERKNAGRTVKVDATGVFFRRENDFRKDDS